MLLDLLTIAFSVIFPPPPKPARPRLATSAGVAVADCPAHPPRPAPAAPQPAPPVRRARVDTADREVGGQFYFRGQILDQLDEYMEYAHYLKRADPKTYAHYSKVGGAIVPEATLVEHVELPPWFTQTLPWFCATSFTVGSDARRREELEDKIFPRFIWLVKSKSLPARIQSVLPGLSIYLVNVFWHLPPWKRHKGADIVVEYPVAVSAEGEVTVLRSKIPKDHRIRHKRGPNRGRVSVWTSVEWGIHDYFHMWASDSEFTAEELMRRTFITAAATYERQHGSMIRVSATKDGTSACFGVDITRTPYFFKDRDPVVGGDGQRKRIFHIARTHARTHANGQVRPVRTHFRGLRQFSWNGYEINITVPGWHHLNFASVNITTIDEDELEPGIAYQDVEQVSNRMGDHIRTGVLPDEWGGNDGRIDRGRRVTL